MLFPAQDLLDDLYDIHAQAGTAHVGEQDRVGSRGDLGNGWAYDSHKVGTSGEDGGVREEDWGKGQSDSGAVQLWNR